MLLNPNILLTFILSNIRLQIADCRLQIADCRLQIAGCRLQVALFADRKFNFIRQTVKKVFARSFTKKSQTTSGGNSRLFILKN